MRMALRNQLHGLVTPNYPSYRTFFDDLAGNSFLAFLKAYPSPSYLKGISVDELQESLHRALKGRYAKRGRAERILEAVAGDGDTSVEFQDTMDFILRTVVGQVEAINREISNMDEAIEEFLKLFDYPLTTIKGMSNTSASQFIAEIGDIRRFPTPAKLAQYAGVCPVTRASGQTDKQFANHRSNRALSSHFFNLALRLVMDYGGGQERIVINRHFREYYERKLSEGKTRKQSLKCVQRRLVNIIWKMMYHNVPYENPEPYSIPPKNEAKQQ
jgi:transposase